MEPLSPCAARGCAPRTGEVADKPRQRRVSVLRVLPLRRPLVPAPQRNTTSAFAQALSPQCGQVSVVRTPAFPSVFPFPGTCVRLRSRQEITPLREEIRAGLRARPPSYHDMAPMLAHALASGNGRERVHRRRFL